MRYKSIQQFGIYTAVASNNCGQCLAQTKGEYDMDDVVECAAKSCGEIFWAGKKWAFVVVSGAGVVELPPEFLASTIDDHGIVYGCFEGLAATFYAGEVKTYGPGRIVAVNSTGMAVGSAKGDEETEFPRIWKDGTVIWEGDQRGTCVDVNESGLVGVNLFHGYHKHFCAMKTTAHIWTADAGLTSLRALHQDTDWTAVTFVDNDAVILGFQFGLYDPKDHDGGDLHETTGIIWENFEPRKIPISPYGKGLVPFFRGPNGEILGAHSIPAELPMSIKYCYDEGYFCHQNGFTENLELLIDGWIYVTGLGGINRQGQIYANLNGELCLLGPDDDFLAKKIAEEKRLVTELGLQYSPEMRKVMYGQDYDKKKIEEALFGPPTTLFEKWKRFFSGKK